MSLGRALRAVPTLLRIGVAETVAYRAEFLVWMLTTTMPLIMLSLWTTVAAEAPFRNYGSADFVAYYLGALIVRNVTSVWVGWQISEEIRMGTMAMRLLRPLHPFIAYAASHAAAIPFRCAVALPMTVILLISSGRSALTSEPLQLAALVPSLLLAWVIAFAIQYALGTAAFLMTKTMALFNLYFGLYSLLSGYLMPIELLPGPIAAIARGLPFWYTLGVPVELMTKSLTGEELAWRLGGQLAWAIATVVLALWLWRRGVRRFEAVGS